MKVALSVDQLVAEARAELRRLTPAEARAAEDLGAVMVDIRPSEERERDGEIPRARVVARNVLEWRLDPSSDYCDRDLVQRGRQVIVVCHAGHQSSLAAATLRRLGVDATDMIGGFQAWREAGLPVTRVGDRQPG